MTGTDLYLVELIERGSKAAGFSNQVENRTLDILRVG